MASACKAGEFCLCGRGADAPRSPARARPLLPHDGVTPVLLKKWLGERSWQMASRW